MSTHKQTEAVLTITEAKLRALQEEVRTLAMSECLDAIDKTKPDESAHPLFAEGWTTAVNAVRERILRSAIGAP